MLDLPADDLAIARRRAASDRNRRSVAALVAAARDRRDRRWVGMLVAAPVAVALVAAILVSAPGTAVAHVVVAAGAMLAVVGFGVAFAVRTSPVHDNPSAPLDRPARRTLLRMATGRAAVEPEVADVVAAVAAIAYRQRWLVLPWGGAALFYGAQAVLTDHVVVRWCYGFAAIGVAVAAWSTALQAVRVVRATRRRGAVHPEVVARDA